MRMSFTSAGVALIRNEPMIALTHTLLPDPVAPAMSRCGIFDRSALHGWPATSWPRANASFERFEASPCGRLASTSLSVTRSNAEFGISTPTYGSPGIGASIRMLRAASASARLSERLSIRLSLMPGSTSRAYCVTTGPSWMRATFTPIPKCASVSRMRWPLAVRSICAALDSGASASRSSVGQLPGPLDGLQRGVGRLLLPHRRDVRLLGLLELVDDRCARGRGDFRHDRDRAWDAAPRSHRVPAARDGR